MSQRIDQLARRAAREAMRQYKIDPGEEAPFIVGFKAGVEDVIARIETAEKNGMKVSWEVLP